MKSKKLIQNALLVLGLTFLSTKTHAVFSTIEVGEATLPAVISGGATSLTPFVTIEFAAPFDDGVTPNVFTMTPEFGTGAADDPCLVRVRNITNTGFDATCLEPRTEDRNSPGTTFEYIAIVDGTTTIPTTTGGTVLFESSCTSVNRQVSGPNCANCTTTSGPAVGYQSVGFINTFSPSAPALLTELISTNNTLSGAGVPIGEPEFLSAGVRNLATGGFDVTLDRLEAGNGNISSAESMCYLAVQRQGCQTLDLSGISGSVASVSFEALFGSNVDGHTNGATTGEGATFASGCFSSTPVAVADMRTRNGNNGGFVRRASVTGSEIILTIDEDRVSDNERSHIDELVSVLAFGQAFTTPVTVSTVSIDQTGRRVKFNWQTTSESSHLGFHLWGETAAGWVQLNKRLLPGQAANTDSTSDYSKKVRLTRQEYNEIQRFGISSVDTSGFEEFYGPFDAGQDYGEEDTSEPIDWAETRKQFDRSMRDKGFVKVNERWRENSERLQKRIDRRNLKKQNTAIDIRFNSTGIRKIAAADLLEMQASWRDMPLDQFAVTFNGNALARHIVSDDQRLSDDDLIVFNAVAPQGRDQVYLADYNYRLVRDRHKARPVSTFDGSDTAELTIENNAYVEKTLTSGKLYSRVITSGNPWFDTRLLSMGRAVSKDYIANFEEIILADQVAQLTVSLFGGIDLPDDGVDHHVQIKVNDELVHDARFDGFSEYREVVSLPAGLLTGDADVVSIIVPGDTGLVADLVLVDELILAAPVALNENVARNFPGSSTADAYQVPLTNNATANVFAHTDSGALTLVTAVQNENSVLFKALPYLQSSNNPEQLRYSVVEINALESAVLMEPVLAKELHKQANDLLIMVHPSFMGEDLDSYVDSKREEGYQPLIVSWLDIVENYGFGNNTPSALNNFLQRAQNYYTPENVLLVGGHTFDYLDVLETGAVNFIPTHYRRISSAEYGPTDNVFADLDADNLPELAIGRWPVRTIEDLKAIIAKSQQWQIKRQNNNYQNALLIAQAKDGRSLNFENSLEGRVTPQLSALSQFSEPTKVYLQKLSSDGVVEPIEQARDLISNAIKSGTDLVSFAGHASTSGWGFQGIVNTQFIQALENHNDPVIVMPLACYTTNYQNLSTNSLAHQWLFAGTQGAAAIHGASMLGDYRENGVFAERMLKQSRSVTRLGKAIQLTKRQMTSTNEMLHNWTLLGDPTLLLE